MGRLIDADYLKEVLKSDGVWGRYFGLTEKVDECPAIETPRGKWLITVVWDRGVEKEVEEKCSLCGRRVYRYDTQPQDEWCPTCGAKMKGGV